MSSPSIDPTRDARADRQVTAHAGRVDFLDGVRAVAIGGVLMAHWGAQYTPLGHGGHIGVDVFFVVSGFVITTVLWRSRDDAPVRAQYGRFLVRRVKRLYPALLALVVVSPIAVALAPGAAVTFSQAAEHAGLAAVQGTWLYEIEGHTSDPFRQTWSLAIEWFFYLLWPLALFALRRRGLTAMQLAKVAAGAAVVLYAAALPLNGRWFYASPPGRFAEILAGAVLALVLIARPERRASTAGDRWLAGVALVAIVAYVFFTPWYYTGAELRWIGVPLSVAATVVLIVHGYQGGRSPVRSLLTWAPVTLVGRTSYSLYLWHWLPLYLLDKDSIHLPTPVLGVIGIALTAALTTASYLLLERPFLSNRGSALRASGARASDTTAVPSAG